MTTRVSMDLPVRLYGMDRSTVRNYVLQELKADPDFSLVFNNFLSAGQGMLFVEVMVNAAVHAMYYGDRRAKNAFLPSADIRSAVAYICETLGYKMRGAVAATAELDVVSLPSGPYAFDVPIPKGTKFIGDGKMFESVQTVTIPAGSTTLAGVIPLRQGENKVRMFTGDGSSNQRFYLGDVAEGSGKFLAHGSVEVAVDGVPWDVVDFIEVNPAVRQCQVNYNGEVPDVQGGDGAAGGVFPDGAAVRVSYFVTDGVAGAVNAGRISSMVGALVVSGQTIPLSVSNSVKASGAYDRETLEEASRNAPRYKRTGRVGVTREDLETLAETFVDSQYGVIAKARAVAGRSASSDHALLNMLNRMVSDVSVPSVGVDAQVTVLNALVADITALVGTIRTGLNGIDAGVSDVTIQRGSVAAQKLVLDTQLTLLSSYLSALDSHISGLAAAAAAITANAGSLLTLCTSTIAGGGGDNQITDGVYSQLVALASSMNTDGGTVTAAYGALSSDKTSIQAVGTALAGVGGALASASAGIAADEVSIGAASTSARTALNSIQAAGGGSGKLVDIGASAVLIASENAGWQDDAMSLYQDIYDHIDNILAHDCKANLVSLPVLALDSEGFYAAPSVGLCARLEEWLNDGRVPPSSYVSVASGTSFLVPANITVTGVIEDVSLLELAQDRLSSVVDRVLKGRAFGASLYEKEFYDAIRDEAIPGVGTALTVTITGPSAYLDSYGSLIIESTRVVTKGTVTFNLTTTA